MLGLTKENNLDFSDHISNTFKTGNQKLNASFRVSASANSSKCCLLIIFLLNLTSFTVPLFLDVLQSKKYVESQQNTKTLLAFNSSYQLSYKEHLDLTNEISPYQLCLNPKTTDVHKCLDQLSLGIINDVPIVSKCG